MTVDNPSIQAATQFVRARCQAVPDIALILGSGLGAVADSVEDAASFDTSDVPGFPSGTVVGHRGRLVLGSLGDRTVLVVQGRLHMYEGHPLSSVLFPMTLARSLGAQSVFVTNAAGGINRSFKPGTLMWIRDHINWTGTSCWSVTPDRTKNRDQVATRQMRSSDPDLFSRTRRKGSPYDDAWTNRASAICIEKGVDTRNGTYLWTRGPSYETQAEIRSFSRLGADAVGMSTVPEVIHASQLGMAVVGLSTITNYAAGLSDELLDHTEVLEIGRNVRFSLETVVRAVIATAP